jgi:hypothetical protein
MQTYPKLKQSEKLRTLECSQQQNALNLLNELVQLKVQPVYLANVRTGKIVYF